MSYIEFTGLNKEYTIRTTSKKVHALKNIEFTLDKGEIVGVIGLNGAGKTTLMKILSGIIKPTSGTVRVGGVDPYKREKEYMKSLGFIMGQKSQLWWDIGAMDSFRIEKEIYKISAKMFEERINSMSHLLGVVEQLNTPVRQLSLGQRMKLELILCLIHSPTLLLLDEPTIGLDILSQVSLRNFIYEYNKKYGNTVLITSHNMNDIDEICDKLILFDKGEIIFNGQKEELYEQYRKLCIIIFYTTEKLRIKQDYKILKNLEYETEIIVKEDQANSCVQSIKKENDIEKYAIKSIELEQIIRILYEEKE